jgi:hypothetical protein
MRAKTELRHALIVIAILGTCAISASAQPDLEIGRSVSAELLDGRRVSGRLISGDSATITIDTAGVPTVLTRRSVAMLSTRSYRAGPAKFLGITGGVLGGLFLGLLADAFCSEDRANADCNGALLAGAGLGATAGGAFMTSLGTSIGAAYPRWNGVGKNAPVANASASYLSPESCTRDDQWAAEAGRIQPRGYSLRGVRTYFCEPDVRSGIEVGYLARPISGSISLKQASQTTYVGFVNERSVGHLPFNPHILGSIQYHKGTKRYLETYRDAAGNQERHDRTYDAHGLGFAVGASVGINPTRRTSVRVEERLLLIPSGMTTTLSVGAHWRP